MSYKIEALGQDNKHPKEYLNCVNNTKLGFNGHCKKKVSEHWQLFRNKDDLCAPIPRKMKEL